MTVMELNLRQNDVDIVDEIVYEKPEFPIEVFPGFNSDTNFRA